MNQNKNLTELNLRNPLHAGRKARKKRTTLALKPKEDVTRSPKQGYQWPHKFFKNKKVLLHECKRHTARRVASARYAALSNGGWGGSTPTIQTWPGGYPPCPDLGWGKPPSRPGMGYPHSDLGYPPHPDLGWGTPPPTHQW